MERHVFKKWHRQVKNPKIIFFSLKCPAQYHTEGCFTGHNALSLSHFTTPGVKTSRCLQALPENRVTGFKQI